MSTSGSKPQNVTFTKQFIAKDTVVFTKGVGVVVDAVASNGDVTVDVAAAGEQTIGIANEAVTGDATLKVEVALLCGGGTMRVKASGTCTAGAHAAAGTDGFENQTFGGGTTVAYGAGQFLQSGVDGDYLEMALGSFASVKA